MKMMEYEKTGLKRKDKKIKKTAKKKGHHKRRVRNRDEE